MTEELPSGAIARELADGRSDRLVREEPLLLAVHGQELLTMRTPGRDEDLARGFLLGEGVIAAPDEIVALRFVTGDAEAQRPDELQVELRQAPTGAGRRRLERTH
ncbi:MAG: formate dehydrogenase accessory sulfurtransferase FdhD, partial [Planctomycetes bacterium]|nr:formate dehydrogenase accessory sulfurtransferase FdhD [Planctomycetota bacterium]